MIEPSDFGLFLKEKRKNAQLTQDEMASAINKSGQYISNIEKGKNNAPPNPSDIEALIRRLGLSNDEANLFKEKASADRGRLPIEQMDYLMKHRILLIYLAVVNILTIIVFGVDKMNAKSNRQRVRIVTLLGLAFIGGSVGALIGMYGFHHKTKKAYFTVGVPLILLMQVVILFYVMNMGM